MSNRASHEARAQALLLWLRRERIVCTELTVGDVSLVVNDMALAQSLVPSVTSAEAHGADDEEAARRNLYAQYGGKAIDEVAKEQEATYEDDD